MDTFQFLHLLILLLFAFLANLPLGYLREKSRRYSIRWFLYIHLSIPFLVLLRVQQGFGWSVIPFTIAFAMAGQLAGGRLVRRRSR